MYSQKGRPSYAKESHEWCVRSVIACPQHLQARSTPAAAGDSEPTIAVEPACDADIQQHNAGHGVDGGRES